MHGLGVVMKIDTSGRIVKWCGLWDHTQQTLLNSVLVGEGISLQVGLILTNSCIPIHFLLQVGGLTWP